jgi:magnesium transporter
MIDVRLYRPGHVQSGIDPADISELVHQEGCLLWVDVDEFGPSVVTQLAEEFSLHPLALEDAQKQGQRPKVERYPSHNFLVAVSAGLAEVDMFIGPDWVITVRGAPRDGQHWPIKVVQERFERTSLDHPTVGHLVHVILDELVDGYFDRADELEDRIEDLEDPVFGEETMDERPIQHELFELRRDLLVFRRAVVPLRDVLGTLLRKEVAGIEEETTYLLQDVYDHLLRVVDQIDSQRELMGNAVDAHLALISNRMNKVMKKMTSWGAILFGSGLIAGVYGMNFEHMPELSWYWGYPMALGLMFALTVVLYVSFRRRDWL